MSTTEVRTWPTLTTDEQMTDVDPLKNVDA